MAGRESEISIAVLSRCDNCPKRGSSSCPIDLAMEAIGDDKSPVRVIAAIEQQGLSPLWELLETNTTGEPVQLAYLGCPKPNSKVPGKLLIQNYITPNNPKV